MTVVPASSHCRARLTISGSRSMPTTRPRGSRSSSRAVIRPVPHPGVQNGLVASQLQAGQDFLNKRITDSRNPVVRSSVPPPPHVQQGTERVRVNECGCLVTQHRLRAGLLWAMSPVTWSGWPALQASL